ncbi:hypothetical protein G6F50_014453 [Rhizopus delemar]|uniref:Uncharacterized protein n=1 Tax=Rhizopus delemar TaxID=936053 RepID=A0A9P6Y5V8_9FUNG|nr:hypothetical protein G6F50_014453 [Rhizopus delemar]
MLDEGRGQCGQDGNGGHGVDQQGFHGAADAVAIGLGVEGNAVRLVRIGRGVDIDMAVAVQMLDEGHAGFLRQAGDQALAAARHDDVDVFGHGDELAYGGAVGGGHDLHGVLRQAGGGQARLHDSAQGNVGVQRFATPAQDGGIAGLQA